MLKFIVLYYLQIYLQLLVPWSEILSVKIQTFNQLVTEIGWMYIDLLDELLCLLKKKEKKRKMQLEYCFITWTIIHHRSTELQMLYTHTCKCISANIGMHALLLSWILQIKSWMAIIHYLLPNIDGFLLYMTITEITITYTGWKTIRGCIAPPYTKPCICSILLTCMHRSTIN